MICADAFARGQVIARALGYMGAGVILSPCAWAVPGDHDQAKEPCGTIWPASYGPVARDFRMWIAGVSNVGPVVAGPWKGFNCIGYSLLMGPDGGEVVRLTYGANAEMIHIADVAPTPRPARGTKWEEMWKNSCK